MMKKKIDYGLKFYRDVLGLDSLHFGYWKTGEEITIENFRSSQNRYIDELISLIPGDVKKILDVGCGTGVVAEKLSARGFLVESITPDHYQAELFKDRNKNILLNVTKYEDFATDKKYDMILMSESFQYLDAEIALAKSLELLVNGGYILLSDYFRKSQSAYYKTCHVESVFLGILKKYPFAVLSERDITEHVLPTLTLASKLYSKYALPILEILSGYFSSKHKILSRAASVIFYFQLKKIKSYLYDRMSAKMDTEKFKRMLVYKIYLVKKI